MNGNNVREISLGDLGEVDIKVNGARVAVHTDGSVDAFSDAAVRQHPLDSDAKRKNAPQIPLLTGSAEQVGDEMKDGTIYAGVSPDTGDPMYVTSDDAPHTTTFNNAIRYVTTLDAHSHKDWRLPSLSELRVIYQNRDEGKLKGTFNECSGSGNAHWYWSCTEGRENPTLVYAVDLTDGGDGWLRKDYCSLSSRPVRTEPRP